MSRATARHFAFVLILTLSSNCVAEVILGPYSGRFGASVSIEGEVLAVGAPDAEGSGRVYLYHQYKPTGSWILTDIISSPSPEPGEQFGASVVVYGYYLLVGAPLRDETGIDSGVVLNYYYNGHNWTFAASVVGTDTAAGDHFGHAIQVNSNSLMAGAPGHAAGAGAAYTFFQGAVQWFQTAKVTAPSPAPGDAFGTSVAIDPDDAVVGAPLKGAAGAAYAFAADGGGWSLVGPLDPPAGEPFMRVGQAVAVEHDVIAVGCPSPDRAHQWTNIHRKVAGAWVYEDTVESYLTECYPGDTGCWTGYVLGAFLSQTPAPGCPFGDTADADNDCDIDFRDFGLYLALNPDDHLSGPTPHPSGAGRSVALAAGRLIVGAPDERTWGSFWSSPPQPQFGSGAVRVCHPVSLGWAEANYLVASDAKYDANFGAVVAAQGDVVVIGAPDAAGPGVGQVYVYAPFEPTRSPLLSYSLVPVKNDLIAGARTHDVVVEMSPNSSGYANDWHQGRITVLTDGQIHQDPQGWIGPPPPESVVHFPKLAFDTFVTSPESYPNVTSGGAYAPGIAPAVQTFTEFSVSLYFENVTSTLAKYTIARVTTVGGTKLEISGDCMDNQVGFVSPYVLKANLKCKADIDDDGTVGRSDLGALLAAYGTCTGQAGFNALADIDFSGCVDQADLGILLAEHGCSAY